MRRALVLGCAASVWRDAAAAVQIGRFDAVAAISNIGTVWPWRVDYWFTLHPELFMGWQAERAANGFNADYIAIAHQENGPREKGRSYPRIDKVVTYRWPGMNASGGSGLLAVKGLLEEGFDRIVLAGVPMDRAGAHYYDSRPWEAVGSFTQAWEAQLSRFRDSTRSMSGWTKELLGLPTPDWLAGS